MQTALDSGFASLSEFNEALRRIAGDAPPRVGGATIVHLTRVPTPLGPMAIGATEEALCLLEAGR